MTAGDQYSYTLVESDGVTPLPVTGVSSVQFVITPPSWAAPTKYTATLAGNVASIVTALTPTPTFPIGGTYQVEVVVNYTAGNVSRSRVYPLVISPSSA